MLLGSILGAWTGWARLSMDLTRMSLQAFDTAWGAGQVIGARTDLIRSAMLAPHRGDYRELSRMLPEKLNAGALAMTAVSRQMIDWPLSSFTPLGMMQRGSAMGSAALAPFHRGVRANVRRLKR